MQQTKNDDMISLSSIGASNQLQFVQMEAKKNEQLKYIDGGKPAFIRKLANDQPKDGTAKQISRSACKESETNVSQTGKYFWPTDIIHDQSGNALKLFKSYIESHKINSYIKLNLEGAIQSHSSTASHPHKYASHHKASPATKTKQSANQEKRSRGHSEGGNLKKKMIKIDYQVVTFKEYENLKERKNKLQSSISKQIVDIKLGDHSIYFQSKSSILQKQKTPQQKISCYIHKDSAPMATTANNSPVYNTCNSNAPKHRTLDIHDKQHLTPNTSTYFHTTNSLEVRDQDLGFHPQNNRRLKKNCVRVSQFLQDQANGLKGYDSNNQEDVYVDMHKPKSKSSKQSRQMLKAENNGKEVLQQVI